MLDSDLLLLIEYHIKYLVFSLRQRMRASLIIVGVNPFLRLGRIHILFLRLSIERVVFSTGSKIIILGIRI